MIEFWRTGGPEATATMEGARRIEEEGWDGQKFMDSQCLTADPYARMAVWALGTEKLKLGLGVTNSLTRHTAVTAAAAATIQSISKGRAYLGIGRGDSALAYLGYAPARLSAFRRTLEDLQSLLSGGEVAFGGNEFGDNAKSLETLSLGDRPTASSLKWLPKDLPKVPLDVAATGPKVIEIAAPIAERVTFSVGAIPARLKWAIDLANAARRKKGLSEKGVSYGAQIVLVCHTDDEVIRQYATRFVAPLARFQIIQGSLAGPVNDSDVTNFEAIRRGYDMNKHGDKSAMSKIIGQTLTWDFVERFAIVGRPERCIERLMALVNLGIERFSITGPSYYPEPDVGHKTLFAREVMPAIRAAADHASMKTEFL